MPLTHTVTHMRRTDQTRMPSSQGLPAHTGFYVSSASLETALRVSLLPASKHARVFPEPFPNAAQKCDLKNFCVHVTSRWFCKASFIYLPLAAHFCSGVITQHNKVSTKTNCPSVKRKTWKWFKNFFLTYIFGADSLKSCSCVTCDLWQLCLSQVEQQPQYGRKMTGWGRV